MTHTDAIPNWMKRSGLWATGILAVTIGIFVLIPSNTPPSTSGIDKIQHVLAFMALVFPVAVTHQRHLFLIAGLAVAYGVLIELVQPYVGRSGELADVVADAVGIFAGIIVALLVAKIIRKRTG